MWSIDSILSIKHATLLSTGASRHLVPSGGIASGSVPANIIRSRDTGILIRVGGVSHDSLRFASLAYAAAFVRLMRGYFATVSIHGIL